MALPDLTGQNIQDTYQRLLQVSSSGQVTDGTGSLVELLDVTASYAVSASHEITYELSSSHAETASIAVKTQNALTVGTGLDLNGSAVNWTGEYARTLTLDLTEVITGDGANRLLTTDGDGTLTAESQFIVNNTEATLNGNLIVSGSVQTPILRGNSDLPTGLLINGYLQTEGLTGHITASGNISASGYLLANEFYSDGRYYSDGEVIATNSANASQTDFGNSTNHVIISADRLSLGSPGATTHITASGNISSSGTVYADTHYVDGNHLASTRTDQGYTATHISFNQSRPIVIGKTTSSPILLDANVTASGNISSSGDGSFRSINLLDAFPYGGTITTHGDISSSANIHGFQGHFNNSISVNGTNINTLYGDAALAGTQTFTGKKTFSNLEGTIFTTPITASGNISATGGLYAISASIDKLHVTDTNIVGQRHILWSSPVFINANSGLVVDAGYFGSQTGNTRGNWNEATAAAFDSSAGTFVEQVNITEDKQNKMFVAPFPISRIEVLASWRPSAAGAENEGFWVGLWTGSAGVRLGEEAGQNNTNALIGLVTGSTGIYYEAANFEGNNLDLDYTFPTPLPAQTQIFYGHGTTETANVSQKNTKGHIQIMVYEA